MGFRRACALALLAVVLSSCGGSSPPPAVPSRPALTSVAKPAPAPAPAPPGSPWFVNVAPAAGLTAVLYCGGTRKDHLLESVGTGAAFVDYDEDGRLDVFLVNAWALDEEPSQVRIKGRNALYRNMGGGRFEDATERAGVA